MTQETSKEIQILDAKGNPIKKEQRQIDVSQIISEDKTEKFRVLSPRNTYNHLNKSVFGNDRTKKLLSVAMKKAEHRINNPQLDLQKSNMLILGDTGCGKTLLVDTLAKSSKLPLIKIKMTGLSREGYEGNSISDMYEKLIERIIVKDPISQNEFEGERLIKNGEYSIVYLDEIDKIAKKGRGNFSEGLQDELIGQIEEAMVLDDFVSTKNMLFIGTGAFTGLEKIIESRLNSKNKTSIGFGSKIESSKKIDKSQLFSQVMPEDLIEYGFKPELVGRFPLIGNVEQLSEQSLISIMNMETSYLSKQKKLLKSEYGIKIRITKDAKKLIAKSAVDTGTNARALQGLIDKIIDPIIYSPSEYGTNINFNKQYVKELLES